MKRTGGGLELGSISKYRGNRKLLARDLLLIYPASSASPGTRVPTPARITPLDQPVSLRLTGESRYGYSTTHTVLPSHRTVSALSLSAIWRSNSFGPKLLENNSILHHQKCAYLRLKRNGSSTGKSWNWPRVSNCRLVAPVSWHLWGRFICLPIHSDSPSGGAKKK